jgi:hypothetical protein
VASLAALAGSGASFYLALGDLNYGLQGTEPDWCALVVSHLGSTFPFQIVAGNHDDGAGGAASIDRFADCLPDRLGSTGHYGREYFFDYGSLLRVILISPGLTIGGEAYRYVPGNPHYDWLVQRIDEARAAGIPWVVVGMHMVCITAGVKTCEIGADLMDLLITKRVDLVLQGHEHNYQRSKQLACGRAHAFVSSCVVDAGADGYYARGAGTVFAIVGAFGRDLYAVDPADAEAGYFARWMGLNADPSHGFLRVRVSASELSAEFVASSGTFTDHFAIGGTTDFELLGVHPQAVAQPTARGRIIGGLLGWKGQVYLGYGDINANTGPITVTSWDPAAAAFRTHWVSGTEAIYNYRPIGGRLYAPALDPGAPPAEFAVGEPWADRAHVGAWHAFDMTTLIGRDLWLVGQQEGNAAAWRSLDGGTTWALARWVPPGAVNHVARFHFAGVYQGKLYLHPWDSSGTGPTSHVFDGVTWSNGPNLLPVAGATGWRPVVYAGRMVYQTRQPVENAGAQLLAFDGLQATLPLATGIYDFAVSGPELYALTVTGAVLRTTDLLSWSPVGTAPPGSRTIATVLGRLYVGTTDSQLYRLRQPLARAGRLVTGTGPGGGPHVRRVTPSGGAAAGFLAFDAAFTGGVFVASGNLDGVDDSETVVGAGPGGGPHVRVFRADGSDFGLSFMAYAPSFRGGVRVAACDVTGDGRAEIVTAPGPGGGPHVRVFTLAGGFRSLAEFFAYGPGFPGGVFVGCGDVDGDGVGEILTGAGAGGGPHVRIWKLAGGAVTERAGFMAYVPDFRGGVRVAALDVDGDGQAEIVTGAGPGGGPHVRVLRVLPATGAVLPVVDFHAYDPAFTGGVFVGGADLGHPVGAAIVIGPGPGGGPHVRAVGPGLTEVASFFAYDPGFTGGVTVAGSE